MNQLMLGKAIAALRKKRNLTQTALAEILDVSNKVIWKWENGRSYPDISLIPRLANALGVSLDNLFFGNRNGIAVVGNLHADFTRYTDVTPRDNAMSNATLPTISIGGCVTHTTLNLAKIDPTLLLHAFGCIGNDENGRLILSRLQRNHINTSGIIISDTNTGTNDIIINPDDTNFLLRTFGANELFDSGDINISNLPCRIIHFSRLALFPRYWDPDKEYGCKLARTLHSLQEAGIQISISLMGTAIPSDEQLNSVLQYCDYVLMREYQLYEICHIPTNSHGPNNAALQKSCMQQIMNRGIQEKVFVFVNDQEGFCLCKNGHFSSCSNTDGVSAADVAYPIFTEDDLCSGVLYGVYCDYTDNETIEFALTAAKAAHLVKAAPEDMPPKKKLQEIKSMPSKAGMPIRKPSHTSSTD